MSLRRSFLGSEPSSVAARIRALVVKSERMKRQTTALVVAPRLKMMLAQRKTRGSSAGVFPRVCRSVVSTPVDSAVCRTARGRMSHSCWRRVGRWTYYNTNGLASILPTASHVPDEGGKVIYHLSSQTSLVWQLNACTFYKLSVLIWVRDNPLG